MARPVTRDETARLRDISASSRDLAAEARDLAAGPAEEALLAHGESDESTIRALRMASGGDRAIAAADRAHAASDRRDAAADRRYASVDSGRARIDLQQARIDLQRAQLDSLTGAYMRELGHVTLQHEIDRSRRSGEPFSLAFIDVDGLKELNDREGHTAGDELLQAVVDALKSNLRSYDPIVRFGGDEFICGFTNTTIEAAERRVERTRAAIEFGTVGASIAIGLASLSSDDTLEELIAKADLAMYAYRQTRQTDG